MLEHILMGARQLYKIGLNGKNALSLCCADGEGVSAQKNLTAHPCGIFSSDIDESDAVHTAVVSESSLTYIRLKDGKSTTTHLMHLPQGYTLTSLCLTAGANVTLNYTVKSRDGCALIEYTLSRDGWHGKNLCTVENDILLLSVGNGKCYIREAAANGYIIRDAYNPDCEIAVVNSPIEYAQVVRDGLIYVSDRTVYKNEVEIAGGSSVYVTDDDRILCGGEALYETVLSGDFRISGRVVPQPDAREYILCAPSKPKRIILSPPFPHIKAEPARTGMLAQEVYMQQKQIFALQAEVKALKNRLRRIEEMKKQL